MNNFKIGSFSIGEGEAPLFFPDIGTFFNRDMAVAEDLVHRLHRAGVRILKGEILHDIDIVLDDETTETYLNRDGIPQVERYRDLIARKIVPLASYEKLFALCHELGMEFLVSVYDIKGADFAKAIGACALKISSSNMVHQPLIEHVAALELPLIIDTGKSTLEEVARSVQWAEDAGARHLVIQHSPEAPPAPLANHHLKMLVSFREVFDRPVGLSDHHSGEEMLYAAVALGAHVVEKGIIPDDMYSDQDVRHALPISQVEEVWGKCQRIYTALGAPMRYLARNRKKYISRMGLAALRNLQVGDILGLDTVRFAFPAKGIPVENWDIVKGWRLRRDLAQGQVIGWQDVEPISP
jgi:sialic acid synthase SpsE